MNIIKVNVNFKNRTAYKQGQDLTSGDYNSTKMVFTFDREDGTKIFEMKNQDDEVVLVTEIQNNEVVLVGQADVTTTVEGVTYIKYLDNEENIYWYDPETEKIYDSEFVEQQSIDLDNLTKVTENASLFQSAGYYTYEISLYDGDSKLTSASDKLKVKQEQVIIDGKLVEPYLPVFDELINQVTNSLNSMDEALEEVDNLDIDVSKTGTTATVEITKKDGTKKSVEIYDGSGGTSDYSDLSNKPKINNVELNGNKTSSDLGLQPAGNYLTSETDPVFSASASAGITSSDITNWNNKSDFSGNYNDLSNKPTIPDVSNFITKEVNNLTYYTLKTNTGSLIDLEINSSTYVITLMLKDIDGNVISTDTVDLPLESVVVSGSFDSVNKKIVLTLQNGNTVDIPVGDLIAGLQTEITSNNKLASDLVDDTNSGHKFVTTTDKSNWNAKYDKPSGGIPDTDLSSAVQTSLGKADSALQSITSSDVTTALGYTPYNSSNPSGYTSNTGTITSVKMNGSTISSSGEADLGTVLTSHQSIKTINSTSLVGTGDVTVQPTLVSGTNIKTVNNESLLGSGNITIQGGGAEEDNVTITKNSQNKIQTVGIIDNNTGNADKVWTGTKQQYDAIQNKDMNTFYYITDDDSQITDVKVDNVSVVSSGVANIDLSGYQTKIDSSHKLSSDLVDDTNNTNKFVTTSEKTTWSAKQDALVSGTNIKTVNNESLLGSGNIEIQGGGSPVFEKVGEVTLEENAGYANVSLSKPCKEIYVVFSNVTCVETGSGLWVTVYNNNTNLGTYECASNIFHSSAVANGFVWFKNMENNDLYFIFAGKRGGTTASMIMYQYNMYISGQRINRVQVAAASFATHTLKAGSKFEIYGVTIDE